MAQALVGENVSLRDHAYWQLRLDSDGGKGSNAPARPYQGGFLGYRRRTNPAEMADLHGRSPSVIKVLSTTQPAL